MTIFTSGIPTNTHCPKCDQNVLYANEDFDTDADALDATITTVYICPSCGYRMSHSMLALHRWLETKMHRKLGIECDDE